MADNRTTLPAHPPLAQCTSKAELHQIYAAGQITIEQLLDAVESLAKNSGGGRTVKKNSSGGLFIRDASFRCWSSAKGKRYTGSCNIPWDVAIALFAPLNGADLPDGHILRAVVEFLAAK
jgi:hypothetical protein